MQHKLSPGPLHNENGHIAEAGYATDEAKAYDRARITAPKFRIKEWDYYAVLAGDYGFACVVADNGYMSLHSATWFDFTTATPTAVAAIGPFPMGKLGMPASADSGDIVTEKGGISLSFTHEDGGRRLKVDAPKWNGGAGFSANVLLHQPQDLDRMTIATPFAENPKAFYYNQKINCMGAEGEAVVGGKTYAFNPATDFGVLDWGRGVWTYDNTWYWGSASGLQNGKPFGFNIGHGFGDTSAATENMLFVDGTAHKLDEVTFHLPQNGFMDDWTFTSNDGRFEMRFTPILDREDTINLVVLRSIGHQVFGHFNGHVVLDDGTKMEVTNLLGFAEEIKNRW